jgi:hypothetical protein
MSKIIKYLIRVLTNQERLLKVIIALKTKVELLEMTNKDLYYRIEVLKQQREQENKEMYTLFNKVLYDSKVANGYSNNVTDSVIKSGLIIDDNDSFLRDDEGNLYVSKDL